MCWWWVAVPQGAACWAEEVGLELSFITAGTRLKPGDHTPFLWGVEAQWIIATQILVETVNLRLLT
jgi:hypothetical protein